MSLLKRYSERMARNWPETRRALKRFGLWMGILLIFMAAFFYQRMFISIKSGHGGVLWKRFFRGTDTTHLYGEGFHIIPPWDIMTIYDMRIQQVQHEFVALSKDGLPVNVELSIRYRPVAKELPMLHQHVGPDYVEKVVKPEVQSTVRFVLAQYSHEQIYTSEGFLLNIIKQGALGQILERNILLDDLLIKKLSLPEPVADAIENKLVQEQVVLEYEYRLKREEKEAARKRLEAAGIRDFQLEVMKGGAFDKYLRYQGIAATVDLASSANAKVVVVGGAGGDGLPLILNVPDAQLDGSAPPSAARRVNPLVNHPPLNDAPGAPATGTAAPAAAAAGAETKPADAAPASKPKS